MIGPLGLCGWAVFGAAAFLAIWELGGFAVNLGEPDRPAAAREPPLPALFRPAAGNSGCTQALIDRATGQVATDDCPATFTRAEILAAGLTVAASAR